jgi:[acyl-carrier-protein] S-malonyltransferase
VEPVVEPANFNSPGQVVIAGSVDAVEEAIALVKAGGAYAGGKAMPLSVSAPFHCRLMAPARKRMAELFEAAGGADKPRAPRFAYVPNRTARLNREPGIVFELLVEQVDHPVLWKQSVEALLASGSTSFAEFGPGRVLTGLIKRIAPKGATPALANVGDLAGFKALAQTVGSKA